MIMRILKIDLTLISLDEIAQVDQSYHSKVVKLGELEGSQMPRHLISDALAL